MKKIFFILTIAIIGIISFLSCSDDKKIQIQNKQQIEQVNQQIKKPIEDPRVVWKRIYKEWFNLKKDFSDFKIPKNYDQQKYFAVIVSQELSMNKIVDVMRSRFNVYLHNEDLDSKIKQNDRTSENGDYVVLFNKNIESDEEFKCLSVNKLRAMGYEGITLMERLLLEILYFDETGEHLDVNNWTLCAGSRYSSWSVPVVHWNFGTDGLDIGWCGSVYATSRLRSRVVVYY